MHSQVFVSFRIFREILTVILRTIHKHKERCKAKHMSSVSSNRINLELKIVCFNTLRSLTGRECHYMKSVYIRSFSRPYFCIVPYSVQMRENTDQKIIEYGHFLRSVY